MILGLSRSTAIDAPIAELDACCKPLFSSENSLDSRAASAPALVSRKDSIGICCLPVTIDLRHVFLIRGYVRPVLFPKALLICTPPAAIPVGPMLPILRLPVREPIRMRCFMASLNLIPAFGVRFTPGLDVFSVLHSAAVIPTFPPSRDSHRLTMAVTERSLVQVRRSHSAPPIR